MRFLCALLLGILIAPCFCSEPQKSSATLQVGLWTLWHDKVILLAPGVQGGAAIRTCENCKPEQLDRTVHIHAAGHKLMLENRTVPVVLLSGPVTVSAHGEMLTVRNPLRIRADSASLIMSVTLPVESYVERVVASESGPADSFESLKALAIVVRSFALHQTHGHMEYDLCDSTHCQLLHWAGNGERTAPAHIATLATAGETLWFRSHHIPTWFNQNCGGHTASPQEVWPVQSSAQRKDAPRSPMPWLTSHADNFCTAKGAREWSTNFSYSDLTNALAAQGLVRPGWKNLSISKRGESGRAVMLRFDNTEITAENFRLAIGRSFGWGRILSTWFELSHQGDIFIFHGRGSGHGIGLCQAGSAAMAAQGRSTSQILAQYFPGTYTADDGTGQAWVTIPGPSFFLETLSPADNTYIALLTQAAAEAKKHSGLEFNAPVMIRAYRTTPAFRDATLATGWVAAFTEGNRIALQPLSVLANRKLLLPVARHEFLHALIESHATAKAALWLREGLAEVWADGTSASKTPPTIPLDSLDAALAHPANESQSESAHRAAGYYVLRALNQYGREQVLDWLRNGVPVNALAAIR